MQIHVPTPRRLLSAIESKLDWLQQRAEALDAGASFPKAEVEWLQSVCALTPALPVETPVRNDTSALELAHLLMLAGQGNLSLGRILEAHINTLHLVHRYGTPGLRSDIARAAEQGCLFALWVTDPPSGGLVMRRKGKAASDYMAVSSSVLQRDMPVEHW